MRRATQPGLMLVALWAGAGCRSGDVDGAGSAAAPAPAVTSAGGGHSAAAAPARPPRAAPVAPLAPEPWHVPVGISLLIEPGKGVGPIRFGAHLETIERLMAEPCEQKREEGAHVVACRYSAQAVEFVLTDGALSGVRMHRLGRPFIGTQPKPDFGIFNGRFESGASLGMLMPAVQELLGKPKAVHSVKEANPYGTIEVHDYAGFSLEYDQVEGKGVILGGVRLNAPAAARSKATQRR